MFGNTGGFGTFGAQNTQQQGTSAFGQPPATNAFGGGGEYFPSPLTSESPACTYGPLRRAAAFGSTGAFGQQPQQQQQQPAANPMFGGFGTNTATTNTAGTGGFGEHLVKIDARGRVC